MDFTINNNYRKSVDYVRNWQNIHNSNMYLADNNSSHIVLTCSENIDKYSLCCLYSDGSIRKGLAGDTDRQYIIGIALHSCYSGQNIAIQRKGKFVTTELITNTHYYASRIINGEITTVDTGLYVGYSLSTTDFFLNISLESI